MSTLYFFVDIIIFTLFHHYYWNNFDEKPCFAQFLLVLKQSLDYIRKIPFFWLWTIFRMWFFYLLVLIPNQQIKKN